ncbi:MAG: hypothetical protein M1501_01235 [Candidatus Omnitrophica bacterium]|nr:hypothetical protein [Candidatus Omnitrophota bacterium]
MDSKEKNRNFHSIINPGKVEEKLCKILQSYDFAIGGIYALRTKYGCEKLRAKTDIDVFFKFELLLNSEDIEKISKRFLEYGIEISERDKNGKLRLKSRISIDGVEIDISRYYPNDLTIRNSVIIR